MFEANLDENLTALMQDLKTEDFRPRPLRRKMIPKGPGTKKVRVGYFRRKLGLLTLEEFCTAPDRHGEARFVVPRHGATSIGVAQ